MNKLFEAVNNATNIAIGGHIRPDGDCIGSCMGLYEYIKTNFSNKNVSVYVDEILDEFNYLRMDEMWAPKSDKYELFISLDCSSPDRLGVAEEVMEKSDYVVVVDHHATNLMFGDVNIVESTSSSTCEVLYTLMDSEKININVANALYTGIVHDTGVFKHSCTSNETMKIAGKLIEKGIDFGRIIDESFFMKNFTQLKLMGYCLGESKKALNDKVIYSVVTMDVMEKFGAKSSDLSGTIDQMRTTENTEVAILMDEREKGSFKVSMRANNLVDVSKICLHFGGGGHVKASGCTIDGTPDEVIDKLLIEIKKQLD